MPVTSTPAPHEKLCKTAVFGVVSHVSMRDRTITALIGNTSDPYISINPSSPPPGRLPPHSVISFPSFFSFEKQFSFLSSILMTQHDFLSDSREGESGKAQESKRRRRRRKNIFLSCRWRYHKMIITTTIWWVHNWLNIKNCSDEAGGVEIGWAVSGWAKAASAARLCKTRTNCSFVQVRINFFTIENWHSISLSASINQAHVSRCAHKSTHFSGASPSHRNNLIEI